MDLADNDPTLFQTWLGAGNTSNTIEIRQIISSEGNDFDIIVVADSYNKLNEAARAIRRAGDTYFPSD